MGANNNAEEQSPSPQLKKPTESGLASKFRTENRLEEESYDESHDGESQHKYRIGQRKKLRTTMANSNKEHLAHTQSAVGQIKELGCLIQSSKYDGSKFGHHRRANSNINNKKKDTVAVKDQNLNSIYQDLQRDTSKSRTEKNEIVIILFQKVLFKNLNQSIGGYFYKRKSHYFDKKDKPRQNFFSGLMTKINNRAKYDKRYFMLDLNSLMFMYAKDEDEMAKKPSYSAEFRNIVSVKKNIVSMPVADDAGRVTFKEVSIYDTTLDLDSGPSDRHNNVFEVKLVNRLFTLYTDDNILMERFVVYISKILELKEEVNNVQKIEDQQIALMAKKHQKKL